ncbi:unnamed protein product [Rhizophagus irregularis]|nr:unnamed protein product [Rhizophagus irregularis]
MSLSFRMLLGFGYKFRDRLLALDIGSFRYIPLDRHWIDIGYPCDGHYICIAESLDPWIEFQSIQIPGWSPGW